MAEVGDAVVFAAMGVLLAIALIALVVAGRAALPPWLRWFTLVCGVAGLASAAFFPWFALLIWGVVAGIWLLVTRPTAAAPA